MIGLGTKLAGGAAALLLVLLIVSMGETRHWRKKTANAEQRVALEKAGHQITKTTYRQAQADADAAQKLANQKIEDARASLSREIARDYEKRLADARARAEFLRRDTPPRTNAASPARHDPVPGPAGPAAGADGAAAQAGLSDADRLIATEQAIQLEELQRWVRDVVGIR